MTPLIVTEKDNPWVYQAFRSINLESGKEKAFDLAPSGYEVPERHRAAVKISEGVLATLTNEERDALYTGGPAEVMKVVGDNIGRRVLNVLLNSFFNSWESFEEKVTKSTPPQERVPSDVPPVLDIERKGLSNSFKPVSKQDAVYRAVQEVPHGVRLEISDVSEAVIKETGQTDEVKVVSIVSSSYIIGTFDALASMYAALGCPDREAAVNAERFINTAVAYRVAQIIPPKEKH